MIDNDTYQVPLMASWLDWHIFSKAILKDTFPGNTFSLNWKLGQVSLIGAMSVCVSVLIAHEY